MRVREGGQVSVCNICLYFNSKPGCKIQNCRYLHLDVNVFGPAKLPRPRKEVREKVQYKILALFIANAPNLQKQLQEEAKNDYARSIILGYLDEEIAAGWEGCDVEASDSGSGNFVFSL